MDITFRKYAANDKRHLLEMMKAFYQIDGYHFDLEKAQKNLLDLLMDKSLGSLFLITAKEEPIGYIVLAFSFSFEYGGRTAFIDELFVKNSYREQGIGKKALIFVEEEAIKLQLKALHLEVELHNMNAKNLYLNHGFKDNNRSLFTKLV